MQLAHRRFRGPALVEIDLVQCVAKLGEETLHLLVAGRLFAEARFGPGHRLRAQQLHARFVGQHLHRGRQIERAERRVGGDMHRRVAELQLFVGQPGALAAEHQRHLGPLACLGHRPGGGIGRQVLLQLHAAGTGGTAQHQAAIGHGLGQGGHHRGVAEHVLGTGRAAEGLLVQRFFGGNQDQAGQAHGLQRTGGGAHVAGVLGTDQDESEAGGGGKLGHEQGKGRAGR